MFQPDPPIKEFTRVYQHDGNDISVHPSKPLVAIDISQCSWHKGSYCPDCLRHLSNVVQVARRELAKSVDKQYTNKRVKIVKCVSSDCSKHGNHEGVIRKAGWLSEMMVESPGDPLGFCVEVPNCEFTDKIIYALRVELLDKVPDGAKGLRLL